MKEIAPQLTPVYKRRIQQMSEEGTLAEDHNDSDLNHDDVDSDEFTIR